MTGKELFALINACLNATATVLLVLGFIAIRRRQWRRHAGFMLSAFAVSCVFLVTYVYSKYAFGEVTTASLGLTGGWVKWFYLFVLIPHVILAVVMLPFIGMALWRASQRRFDLHVRWSRPAFWMWLYVSITGVVVYIMLFHLIPAYVALERAS